MIPSLARIAGATLLLAALGGCGQLHPYTPYLGEDTATTQDTGSGGSDTDAGTADSGSVGSSGTDSGSSDSGTTDSGVTDSGDSGATDTGGTTTVCSDTCVWANDGMCDDGGAGAETWLCDLGTDCTDCGAREAPSCTNTCVWANDGWCDDGGPGSDTWACDLGTDCADCGPR